MANTWEAIANLDVNEPFARAKINALLENQRWLRSKNRYFYQRALADGDYSLTSTTFANVDATNMSININTFGGDLVVCWGGRIKSAASTYNLFWELVVDSSALSNDVSVGLAGMDGANAVLDTERNSWRVVVPNLAAGSHSVALQYRLSAAGTYTWQVNSIIQFEVYEIGD